MTISTADALMYSILLLILFLVDIFVAWIAFALKLRNERDEEGNILSINLQKYLKIITIGILYGLILLTLNLMNAVAQNLADITQFAGIIGGLFSTMLQLAWPWTICIIIWIGIAALQDSKFSKEIKQRFEDSLRSIH